MRNVVAVIVLNVWMGMGVVLAQSADTVVVELARTSKVVLTIGDRSDIDVLKRYDFQSLFDDIFLRLQAGDSTGRLTTDDMVAPVREEPQPEAAPEPAPEAEADKPGAYVTKTRYTGCCGRYRRTSQSFNIDFGINNFLQDGQFPDAEDEQYTVRPWGSWYVGVNSVLRTDISRNFYLELGLGVSWYNFKFEDDRTLLLQDDQGVYFATDPRDLEFERSKLSMTYLNASLVPMVRFGQHHHHHHRRFWNSGGGFRIGIGPYAGYRLESHTKQVYEIDGETEVDKEWDNFYLNNLRYGLRLQFGVQDVDFFINYDLNTLFAEGKGPELNAFSFGLIF